MEPRRSARARKPVQVFDPALLVVPQKVKKPVPEKNIEDIYRQSDAQECFKYKNPNSDHLELVIIRTLLSFKTLKRNKLAILEKLLRQF